VRIVKQAAEALELGWFDGGCRIAALGEGHINDTLLVTRERGRFVLQRINSRVFSDPARVMANLQRVQDWLARRAPGMVPELVPTRTGALALVDATGEWWRLWRYVEGARTFSRTDDPRLARAAGQAFGRFQRLLATLEEPELEPTIPGFLELSGYLEALEPLLSGKRAELPRQLGEAADFISHRTGLAQRFPRGASYVHGDCKLNNLLFAETGTRVVKVLDLDTVMRGHWAWDFGDLSRSLLLGDGDRAALFRAVVAGFVSGAEIAPDPLDLVAAPRYLTFMLGVRFLTDHLQGDQYFRVRQGGDNLRRAAEQFDLLLALEADEELLTAAARAALAGNA
jgi:Ser/Thr protein kinase RdoA (MazF antagonist)